MKRIEPRPNNYIYVIEQHLLACRIQLLESGGCCWREIGQFSSARIFDDTTRVRIEGVRDAALHLRHRVLTEAVCLAQVDLQTLLGRKS